MLKVCLYVFQDQPGFSFTESLNNPFFGIVITLAQITRLTSWQNIGRDIAGVRFCQYIIRFYWNMVFLVKNSVNIEQTWWITAIDATATKIMQCSQPILFCKRIWLGMLFCPASLIFVSELFWVISSPFTLRFALFFWIVQSVIVVTFTLSIWMVLAITLLAFSGLFSITITNIAFVFLFGMRNSPLTCRLLSFIRIVGSIAETASPTALATPRAGLSISEAKILQSVGVLIATFCTAFNRGIHNVFLSLYSMSLSAGAGIRRFLGSYSLADETIIAHFNAYIYL